MRFIDEAQIQVRAGNGGRGCVSFRREKFIPKGGPNGGNGGDGGSVYFCVDTRLLSLYDFRLKRSYAAQNGMPGQGSQCDGKKGDDLYIRLPLGTQIFERNDLGETLLADLAQEDACVLAAKGGRGGKGNEFFKSSTMRAPRFAQKGEEGEVKTIRLELKILADVGLLGLPNAGKSTFISQVSAAKPRIAPYPFTTLEPNLGVMLHDQDIDRRLIIADIPGLIQGAHAGQGLGHKFLRHIERTRFLLHIVSCEDINADDPFAAFHLLNEELKAFDSELAERKQIEVINKIDLLSEEELACLTRKAEEAHREIFFISAKEKRGLEPLLERMWKMAETLSTNAPLATCRSFEDMPLDPDEGQDEDDFDVAFEYTRE